MRKIFLFLVSFCLVGCMSETFKGQSNLEKSSFEWIPFQGGERVVFTNADPNAANISMSYELGARKSVFNSVTDCHAKNIFTEQCDVYSMECNFITATSIDKKNTLTYTIERGMADGKFYDELKLVVHIYGNPELKMNFQVFNEQNVLTKDCQYSEKIDLGEKTFYGVYAKETNGQIVYFTKEKGVLAFKVDGENLWVRM
jgi:hypothetical protein